MISDSRLLLRVSPSQLPVEVLKTYAHRRVQRDLVGRCPDDALGDKTNAPSSSQLIWLNSQGESTTRLLVMFPLAFVSSACGCSVAEVCHW